jgi:tetratricopeptide (TPR) repeat protein
VAGIAGNLAVVERELGNPRRAIELHMTDLELSSRVLGPEHPVIGTIWLNLARTTERTGDYAAALVQIESALAIFRKNFAPGHGLIATSENSRARYLAARGRSAEAARILRDLLERSPESNEARVAMLVSRLQLAALERGAGRFEAALALTGAVLADPIVENDPKLLADAYWAQACVFAARGDMVEAARVRGRAIEVQAADAQETAPGRIVRPGEVCRLCQRPRGRPRVAAGSGGEWVRQPDRPRRSRVCCRARPAGLRAHRSRGQPPLSSTMKSAVVYSASSASPAMTIDPM